jgi:hypothetical protein
VGDQQAWTALGELYHRYLTGLLLAVISRRGDQMGADLIFTIFRRQQLELFLPGLEKLGLAGLPDAVACARYHVESNALGGVPVAWIPESDRKSWVRYYPPRWIFDGTAVCGVPGSVNRAMMAGWHANSGVLLNNPRLGFVCTMQTTEGQAGLEGYYIEHDDALAPQAKLRFEPGTRPPGPPVFPTPPDWPIARLAKARRNYATAYIRSALPALVTVLGPAEGAAIGRLAARQVAIQFHGTVMQQLSLGCEQQPLSFADRLAKLLRAYGDTVTVDPRPGETLVRQSTWHLAKGWPTPLEGAFEAWNGLWEGLAEMEDRRLDVVERIDLGDDHFTWRIRER